MCYKVRSQEQNERTHFLSYKVCQSHTCVQKQITGEGWGRRVDLGKVLVTQSCPTLCDPTDCSPPGSSVHGILQARILEWVAMPSSRGSSRPMYHLLDPCIKHASPRLVHCRWILYTTEPQEKPDYSKILPLILQMSTIGSSSTIAKV